MQAMIPDWKKKKKKEAKLTAVGLVRAVPTVIISVTPPDFHGTATVAALELVGLAWQWSVCKHHHSCGVSSFLPYCAISAFSVEHFVRTPSILAAITVWVLFCSTMYCKHTDV